jgi:hypothetical protein
MLGVYIWVDSMAAVLARTRALKIVLIWGVFSEFNIVSR